MKAGCKLSVIPILTLAATLCAAPGLEAVSPPAANATSPNSSHKKGSSKHLSNHTRRHASASDTTRKTSHRTQTAKATHTVKRSAHKSGHQKIASHRSTAYTRLAHMQMDPERVEDIQQALIKAGDLHGTPTGRWDEQTREAMARYQTTHGFGVTGLPDAKSLMKLGLGPHPLPPQLDKTGPSSAPGLSRGDAANPPSNPGLTNPASPPSTAGGPPSVAPPATANPPARH